MGSPGGAECKWEPALGLMLPCPGPAVWLMENPGSSWKGFLIFCHPQSRSGALQVGTSHHGEVAGIGDTEPTESGKGFQG